MSDRHDLATTMAVLKVLLGQLSDAKKVADVEIRDGWIPGDRNTALLPGGKPFAAVSLAKGRTTANVTDTDVYEAWVKDVHPEQIEQIFTTRVRPDFTERIKSAAKKLGVAVDAETGEEVPGITVSAGDPYPMVKLTEDAREAVAKAWRDGSLLELLGTLLAIEGGE